MKLKKEVKMEKKPAYYVDYKILTIRRLLVYADSKQEALELARDTVDLKNIFTLEMPMIYGSYSICGVGKEK